MVRSSSILSLEKRSLKTASCESDRCLTLRKSARLLVLQTHSHSTRNTTTRNLEARLQIWANGVYSGPVNKQGYSRGAEIFRAVEAMKAKEYEMAVKAMAK